MPAASVANLNGVAFLAVGLAAQEDHGSVKFCHSAGSSPISHTHGRNPCSTVALTVKVTWCSMYQTSYPSIVGLSISAGSWRIAWHPTEAQRVAKFDRLLGRAGRLVAGMVSLV